MIAFITLACAVCFGDPNSSLTRGQNAGIFALLGVIGLVLTGCLIVIVRFARRARAVKELPQVG